jgi:hypothetical protein
VSILTHLKAWRARWHPPEAEDTDAAINKEFAIAFSTPAGKAVVDYLIETYYRPIDGGVTALTAIDLAERNGQQKMLVDILSRYDRGAHPMAFEPEHSSEDGSEVDVRQ